MTEGRIALIDSGTAAETDAKIDFPAIEDPPLVMFTIRVTAFDRLGLMHRVDYFVSGTPIRFDAIQQLTPRLYLVSCKTSTENPWRNHIKQYFASWRNRRMMQKVARMRAKLEMPRES